MSEEKKLIEIVDLSNEENGNIVAVYGFSDEMLREMAIESIHEDDPNVEGEELEFMIKMFMEVMPRDQLPVIVLYENAFDFGAGVAKSKIEKDLILVDQEGTLVKTAMLVEDGKFLEVIDESELSGSKFVRIEEYKIKS